MAKTETSNSNEPKQTQDKIQDSGTQANDRRAEREARRSERRERRRQWRDRDYGAGRALWAAALIGLGVLFLINNYHLIPNYAWNNLGRLWPLVIIFPGLRLLIGRSRVASWVITVIGILIIVAILAYMAGASNSSVSHYFHQLVPQIPATF